MNSKEAAEGYQLNEFIRLYNLRYGTDYEIGLPEEEYSIIDRKAISKSGKYQGLKIQLKDVVELDTTPLTRSIVGNGAKIFNLNIFKILNPLLKKVEKKYGTSSKNIILVLNVGVSEDWLKDFVPHDDLEKTNFLGIYCLGVPTSLSTTGFIFPLKEISDNIQSGT